MKQVFPFIIITFLYSCASIVPPNGGPIDKKAPLWDRAVSVPDSINNTNYLSNEIVLYFNEPIDIKNLQKEVISNPDINKTIEYKIKKKRVHFSFNESLDTNTTYVINFGNSIVDITEGNPAKNIIVAFSTGNLIDSLEIFGSTIDNFSQKPIDNVVLGLYPASDTLNIEKQKPKYYTKTESNGNFHFNYIKKGKYIIRAFEDNNNNLLYDKYKEKVGFIDSTFNLDKTITNTQLNLFLEKEDTLYIKSIKRKDDHIAVLFSRGIKTFEVSSDTSKIFSTYDQDENIVKIFTLDENPRFNIKASDSTSNLVDSTAKIINFQPSIPKNHITINNKLSADYQIDNNTFSTEIVFSTPLDFIIYDSITVLHGTDSLNSPINSLFSFEFNEEKTKLKVTSKFQYVDSLQLFFKKGAIKNIYGFENRFETLSYLNNNPKKFGVLAGQINTSYKNYLFQLLLNEKIIAEHKDIVAFEFKDLLPGLYQFRIIEDKNNNGIYDTGNLNQHINPEAIYYHPTAIQLKANWEIIDLLINTEEKE